MVVADGPCNDQWPSCQFLALKLVEVTSVTRLKIDLQYPWLVVFKGDCTTLHKGMYTARART